MVIGITATRAPNRFAGTPRTRSCLASAAASHECKSVQTRSSGSSQAARTGVALSSDSLSARAEFAPWVPRGRRGRRQVKRQRFSVCEWQTNFGLRRSSPLSHRAERHGGRLPASRESGEDRRSPKFDRGNRRFSAARMAKRNDLTPQTLSLYIPYKFHISA
jgi:hypothetical protein